MEQAVNNLKEFIKSNLKKMLETLEDNETPLPMPAKIAMGYTDISRIEAKCLCVLVPETLSTQEGNLKDGGYDCSITVAFLIRGSKTEVLQRQMCRYALAFRRIVEQDASLGGTALDAQLGTTDFFPNCGATDGTMAGCETSITIQFYDEFDGDPVFE